MTSSTNWKYMAVRNTSRAISWLWYSKPRPNFIEILTLFAIQIFHFCHDVCVHLSGISEWKLQWVNESETPSIAIHHGSHHATFSFWELVLLDLQFKRSFFLHECQMLTRLKRCLELLFWTISYPFCMDFYCLVGQDEHVPSSFDVIEYFKQIFGTPQTLKRRDNLLRRARIILRQLSNVKGPIESWKPGDLATPKAKAKSNIHNSFEGKCWHV